MQFEEAAREFDGLLNTVLKDGLSRHAALRSAPLDLDDLKQFGLLELQRCLKYHDPEKGPLKKLVRHNLYRMLGQLAREKEGGFQASFENRVVVGLESLPHPQTDGDQEVGEREALVAELNKLAESDRELLMKRFGVNGHQKQSVESIAADSGLSRWTVRRRVKAALEELKGLIEASRTRPQS